MRVIRVVFSKEPKPSSSLAAFRRAEAVTAPAGEAASAVPRKPIGLDSGVPAYRNYHPLRCGKTPNLADVQLFTSVPLRISRRNAAGDEIGASYQADCIASWITAGFAPATINARSERVHTESRVRQVTIERDASEITGRRHPYFGDVLSAIAEQANGPFALVNADIIIPSGAGLAERVTSLRRGQMIFSRRLDVAELGASGKPYFNGYDFFAAHSEDAAVLAKTRLVFGAPWWDHFLPLAMHLHGCQVMQVEPRVIHLRHDERWNWATYRRLGDRFVAEMGPMVTDGEYAQHLRGILDSRTNGQRALVRHLAHRRWWPLLDPEGQRRRVLDRVSNLNLAAIDRLAPPPASSRVRPPAKLRVQAKLLRLGAASDIFSATSYTRTKS
jgi:hypothetical protein